MGDKDRPKIAASEEVKGDLIGRYRLIERIGQGAWGSVWLAEQTEDIERRVALKILKLGLDTKDFLSRFDSERRAMAMMDHTHIAKILDTGSTDYGRPYLVMEYIEGLPLLEYANERRLSLRDRVALFIDVCRALDHAHEKGIIHRDIKPSNILVAEQDGKPLPKIIDFGIAKTNEVQLSEKAAFTNIHTFIGTPLYSSPEQLEFMGVEVDARSDVYSLGAVLYQLLCGRTVFDLDALSRRGVEAVRKALINNDPPMPSERFGCLGPEDQKAIAAERGMAPAKVESTLDGDLDGIVMKCLEKERERRYSSAGILAQDLTAYLEHRAVIASRPNLFTHVRKFLKRHEKERNVALIAVAGTLLLLGSFYFIGERQGLFSSGEEFVEAFGEPGSLAVMPLKTAEGEGANPAMADGLRSELVSALSSRKGLRTLSQLATAPYLNREIGYQEIGRELGVAHLLVGSISEQSEQVVADVQILDTSTEAVVWSNRYLREVAEGNWFDVQSDMSRAISSDVEAVLAPKTIDGADSVPTQNLEALKAYLEAREIVDRDMDARMGEALELFQKAVELDPNFALAHVGLGETCRQRVITDFVELSREEINEKLAEAAMRALELDDRLPQAHVLNGFAKINEGALDEARSSFRRALEIEPGFPDALFGLAQVGVRGASSREAFQAAIEEAVEMMESAIEEDPRNPYYRFYMATILGQVGRASEILEHYRMAAFHNPDSIDANDRLSKHWINEYNRYDEGIVYQRKAHALKPSYWEFAANIREAFDTLGGFEEAAFWTEREMKLNRDVAPLYRANLLRFQGDMENALEAYREGLAIDDNPLSYMGGRLWALYDDLRSGDLEAAIERYRKGAPELLVEDPEIKNGYQAQLGLEAASVLQALGEDEGANRLIDKIAEFYEGSSPGRNLSFYQAIISVLKGDRESALTHFRSAVDQGLRNRLMLADARLDPLRNDPRFIESMDIVETEMAEQLAKIRKMESNGELAPLPRLPE